MTPPSQIDPEKKAKIDEFLKGKWTARIATANPKNCQPHVVPVWYLWDGESVYIHAYIKFRKSRELLANPRCSIAIDTEQAGQPIRGVILEGKAEIVAEPRQFVHDTAEKIYLRYITPEEVSAPAPQSWLNDPEITLIKLTPSQIYIV